MSDTSDGSSGEWVGARCGGGGGSSGVERGGSNAASTGNGCEGDTDEGAGI